MIDLSYKTPLTYSGIAELPKNPLPNCPSFPKPHTYNLSLKEIAAACADPAEIYLVLVSLS
jgi:hypothetical protein